MSLTLTVILDWCSHEVSLPAVHSVRPVIHLGIHLRTAVEANSPHSPSARSCKEQRASETKHQPLMYREEMLRLRWHILSCTASKMHIFFHFSVHYKEAAFLCVEQGERENICKLTQHDTHCNLHLQHTSRLLTCILKFLYSHLRWLITSCI